MPTSAIVRAAITAARLAGRGAAAARRAARAGIRDAARLATRLAIATRESIRMTYRSFISRARIIAQRAAAFGKRLWEQLSSLLVRLRRSLVSFVQTFMRSVRLGFVRGLGSGLFDVQVDDESVSPLTQRVIARMFYSIADDERAFIRALAELETLLEEEQRITDLRLSTLRARAVAAMNDILEEFFASSLTEKEEEEAAMRAVERFVQEVEPYSLAARALASGDATVYEDPEAMEQVMADLRQFERVLANYRSGMQNAQKTMLRALTAVDRAIQESFKRAKMRQMILADLFSVNPQAAKLVTLGQFARQVAEKEAELLDLVERMREQAAKSAQEIEKIKQIEEDETIYGVWETNARAVSSKNCEDCLALEALTHSAPVPIVQLPVPGAETVCGERCNCAIRPVSASEFVDMAVEYYASRAPISPERFRQFVLEPDEELYSVMFATQTKQNVREAMQHWALRLYTATVLHGTPSADDAA